MIKKIGEPQAVSCKRQAAGGEPTKHAIKKNKAGGNAGECKTNAAFLLSRVQLIACCLWLAACIVLFSSCGIYTFKDVSIPPEVKTVKISYIENKARIVNPQLSPRLTDALQQKISNQTKLTRTTSDDAHYQISGAITNYFVSTVGVSGKQTNQNQLTIGVHIVFKNTLQNKTDEFDISRDFPFAANQTLDQAVNSQFSDILKNLTDEIFNHIFSNW